ncbi:MAG: hypothetical protein R3F39_14685 [Myxococcota bacterium]
MRRFGAPGLGCALVVLLLAACGGEDEGDGQDGGGIGGKPVAITAENLDGYWISDSADVPLERPVFLHFGPANVAAEEARAGVPVIETAGVDARTSLGPFILEADGSFEMQRATQTGFGTYGYGKIEALTKDALEIQFSKGRTERMTFRRVEGCGGPGLWFGPSDSRVVDAAWGPDGALHMLSVPTAALGDLSGYYQWISPGRCTPYSPPVSIIGDSVDVGAEGTIRIVQVDKASNRRAGGVTLVKIERAPWNRPQLEPNITTLTTELSSSAVRPATRAIALSDGRTLALWADGDTLHAWEEASPGSFEHSERPLLHGSKISPQFLDVQPAGDGGFVVRGDRQLRGLKYRDGAWSEWNPASHPELGLATVFAYGPDGLLHAAWARKRAIDTRVATVVVGRRRGDGGWDTVEAGLGTPQAIHVLDDGTIDVIATWEANRAPMAWIRVGKGLQPDSWREAYTLHGQDQPEFVTTYTADESVYPIARFGPDGQVLVGGRSAAWRRPHLEGDGRFEAFELPVTFEGDTALTLVLPTLGLECREDCTLNLPPREVIPARLEAPAGAARLLLTGNVLSVSPGPAGPSWALISQPPLVAGVTPTLQVRGSVQQVLVAPISKADALSEMLGSDVDAQGRTWAVWRDGDGKATLTRFDAALGALDSRALTGLSVTAAVDTVGATGVLRALAAGGAVIYVDGYPGIGRALVFVDDALAEVEARPLDALGKLALTADGAWEGRPAIGGYIALVHHTRDASSSPAQTDLIEAPLVLAVGDGVVVVGTSPTSAQPVATRFDALGAAGWTLEVQGGSGPSLMWRAAGDDVLLFARYQNQLLLGGTTLKAVSQKTAALVTLSGKSGAVLRQRVGGVGYPELPTALARDAGGVALLWAHEAVVRFEYMPWSEGASGATTVEYLADVPAGFCAQAGKQCAFGTGFLTPSSLGGFGAAWTQRQPVDYDGLRVDSAGKRAVVGQFVVAP